MHFDPAASTQDSSVAQDHRLVSSDFLDPELDQEPDEPAPHAREGLPPAFRMRHARHYVEQLMGDAPLRTVREIAIADIEPPPVEEVDVQDLERSIRQLGVLEPLLVTQLGRRYRVIAGMNRLRAARNAGLGTVPCLVHDVDEEMLHKLRQAATQRGSVPPPPEAPDPEPLREGVLPPAFADITEGLGFVSALLPAIAAAGDDRFRWTVLTEMAGVELLRARTAAGAAGVLSGTPELEREESSSAQLVEEALAAVSTEARLRGIRMDASVPHSDYRFAFDRKLAELALTGVLQSMLSLLSGPGVLRVSMSGARVRPALIVTVSQGDVVISAEGVKRFFEVEWREHPAGSAGALMLAAAMRVARLHGGRLDVQHQPIEGCTVTFVIPRPLTEG